MPRPYSRGMDDYELGYRDGYDDCMQEGAFTRSRRTPRTPTRRKPARKRVPGRTKPRKLSAWQRYIKNKKNHIKMRNGKLNLKKMAVQYRKKKKR